MKGKIIIFIITVYLLSIVGFSYSNKDIASSKEIEKVNRVNMDRHLFLLISLLQNDRRRINQLNNSVTFSGRAPRSFIFLTG